MRIFPLAAILLLASATVSAHPMGNLSLNHYTRLEPGPKGVDVVWALDLAELPTFELTQSWGTPAGTSKNVLDRKAAAQAREWLRDLDFRENGKRLRPALLSTELAILDGAGNLPVFRITSRLHVPATGGRFEFEDRTFSTRAGWREIVVTAAGSAQVQHSSQGSVEISQGLTSYPQDPTKAPPQDSKAWFEWSPPPAAISRITPAPAPRISTPAPVPAAVLSPSPKPVETGARPPEAPSAGTVQRNDAISRILRQKEISWPLMATLIGLAFWFGALHALEPGHGKTMVAAYLVGERGNARHAAILGGTVTFTHTITVFVLGVATMFLSRYIMPEKISKVLGIVSGLSIVWIGGMMLWRRWRSLGERPHTHGPSHNHPHSHGAHTHTHGGQTHTHRPPTELSLGSLIALGATGGLVPCPSALILLLSAISIGRPGLGLVLLVAFSLGLALVLTATGLVVLYAKNLLPAGRRTDNAFFRYMPVFSAAAILAIGVVMTSVSLGWISNVRLIG